MPPLGDIQNPRSRNLGRRKPCRLIFELESPTGIPPAISPEPESFCIGSSGVCTRFTKIGTWALLRPCSAHVQIVRARGQLPILSRLPGRGIRWARGLSHEIPTLMKCFITSDRHANKARPCWARPPPPPPPPGGRPGGRDDRQRY